MIFSVPANLGYGALFGLIAAESAGVPVPGESSLIAASLFAAAGQLSLPIVIVIAAAAAVIGDNIGYWAGRRGGRGLLLRAGPLAGHRRHLVERGEAFFARHGAKTVFLGRWVTGVRVVAAVLAGAGHMPWRRFLVYNLLGAITWATGIAIIATLLGPIGTAIVYGAGIAIAAAGGLGALRQRRRRRPVASEPA
ncbi:MAG: DedA family protein [Solirubrobacteraceae bacterium]